MFGVRRSMFKVIKATAGLLSSSAFLIWLTGGWIVFYVFSSIWMKDAFAYFVEALKESYLIQVPFLLFLLSGWLNLVRASCFLFPKGKRRFIVWVMLPLGMILFFTGFFISITTRQFEWLMVGLEHVVQPKWGRESYKVVDFQSGMKERFLDMDLGTETGKGIFSFEPKIKFVDRNSRSFEAGAFPPVKFDETYFHILNFGLAPGVRFLENGIVKDEGYMPLRIINPGSADSFEIKPYPYKFLVSLEPERIIRKGKTEAGEYNIRVPKYKVRVFEGDKVIAEAVSKEGIQFKNLNLTFFDPTFWIQLEIARDYGYPGILAGIFLIAIGIPLYLFQVVCRLFATTQVFRPKPTVGASSG